MSQGTAFALLFHWSCSKESIFLNTGKTRKYTHTHNGINIQTTAARLEKKQTRAKRDRDNKILYVDMRQPRDRDNKIL